jgi:ABC-type phosphate/phosphonate transport system substrate-binding protein
MRKIFTLCVMVLLVGIVGWIGAFPENSETNLGINRMRFGISTSIISGEVNQNDVLAMAKIWASMIGAGTTSWENAEGEVFADVEQMKSSLNSSAVDLIAMSTIDYVQSESKMKARPSFTYSAGGQVEVDYLLLVHKDSNIHSIRDLKNKRIAITSRERNNLAPLWIDILLVKAELKTSSECLVSLKSVNKSAQAVLPVFFRQMDAAIVSRQAFETSSILNPQLAKNLIVIATSPPLVPVMVVMRDSLVESQKALFLERALKLHETPRGLQTLTTSKLDRMAVWKSEYAVNVRKLVEEHEKLSKHLE